MIAYPLDRYIEYNGKRYEVDLAFDNILRMFDLQKEELFTDTEKLDLSLEMLIGKNSLLVTEKAELFKLIFEQFISTGKGSKSDTKVVDFNQDAPHIYASFLMDYGIDLVEMQGSLDWRKFIALFQGLSGRTKMREIMTIRSKPLPKPTKYNQEEIQALQEAKAYYAIKLTEAEAEEAFQKSLDKFADSLARRAKKAGEKK